MKCRTTNCVIVSIAIVLLTGCSGESDKSYYETTLAEAGLNLADGEFSVENKFCEDAWVDAAVYFKLRLTDASAIKIVERIKTYSEYRGEIDMANVPEWWNPSPSAMRFCYYTNTESASPLVVAYIDPVQDGTIVYLAVIPV